MLTWHVENYYLKNLFFINFLFILLFFYFSNWIQYSEKKNSNSIQFHIRVTNDVWKLSLILINEIEINLSLIKLAFAKHSKGELIRRVNNPGVLIAIGYWFTSPKISVFDNLPKASMFGLIELNIILANDIPTYIYK